MTIRLRMNPAWWNGAGFTLFFCGPRRRKQATRL